MQLPCRRMRMTDIAWLKIHFMLTWSCTLHTAFSLFEGKGAPNVFSVLFFVTLLLLGIDSAMSLVEAVCEALIDNFKFCRRHVPLVSALVCLAGFLVSLIMTTRGGYQILDIIDHFSSNYLMLLGGGISTIIIGWGYPAEKLVTQVKTKTGQNAQWLPFLWTYMCKFVTPAILLVLFVYNAYKDMGSPYGGYPQWALFCFGWLPALVFPVLVFALPSLFVFKRFEKEEKSAKVQNHQSHSVEITAIESADEELREGTEEV